jgi:hypothetical protein
MRPLRVHPTRWQDVRVNPGTNSHHRAPSGTMSADGTFSLTGGRREWQRPGMRIPLTLTAVLALLALSSGSVFAAPDELMSCKMLSVKVKNVKGMGVKFVCKAPKSGFALPQGSADPTAYFGMSLLIRDLGSDLYIVPGNSLPTSGWTGLGNPPGSRGFRYKNTAFDAPCRVVKVTTKEVSGTCRLLLGPGSLPVVGDVGMTLAFVGNGDDSKNYCAQFGGTNVRNDEAVLIRKNAPAPDSCPPAP